MIVQHEPNHHVVTVCHLEAQVGSSLELSPLVFVIVLQLRRWGTIHYYLGTDLCEPYCPLLPV